MAASSIDGEALRAFLLECLSVDYADKPDVLANVVKAFGGCPDPYDCWMCQGILHFYADEPGFDARWVNEAALDGCTSD